jgi:hypothetical protein
MRVATHQLQNAFAHEVVVHDHVGLLHQTQRAESEQIRVAWSCPDQIDFPALRFLALRMLERRLEGLARRLVATGERQF